MTRARALKQIIRARAAKTGERYTTARRHVLNAAASAAGAARGSALPTSTADTVPAAPPASTKGGISDASVRARTGHGFDHWFAVLDRFGGLDKGHTASARHLYADHEVSSWYAQGITVAYERARGARGLNQRMSGEYEVSVTKTMKGDAAALVRAFTDARRRAMWLKGDRELGDALAEALRAPTAKGFVIRPDQQGRFRYRWGTTTVQIDLYPKGEGRTAVVVTHLSLADAEAVEVRRAQWRAALGALAGQVP